MPEKLKLDLSLVLPDIPDERDACVGRLTELLQTEGLEKVHLIREEDGGARLCLHYDPQRYSVSRVRALAQLASTVFAVDTSVPGTVWCVFAGTVGVNPTGWASASFRFALVSNHLLQ